MYLELSLWVNSPGCSGSSHLELLRGLHPFCSGRGSSFSRLFGTKNKIGIVQGVLVLTQLERSMDIYAF